MRLVASCAALVSILVLSPTMASAQTVNCSTTDWGPSFINRYYTTCTDSSSYTSALVQLAEAEMALSYQQTLAAQQAQAIQAEQAREALLTGVTINMGDGTQRYLAPGALVKIGQAPAIYWVYGGQFHAFQTWPQFLSVGGRPDLSNVTYFSSMTDGGGLYGAPVPLN
jgi:hypothetical protein